MIVFSTLLGFSLVEGIIFVGLGAYVLSIVAMAATVERGTKPMTEALTKLHVTYFGLRMAGACLVITGLILVARAILMLLALFANLPAPLAAETRETLKGHGETTAASPSSLPSPVDSEPASEAKEVFDPEIRTPGVLSQAVVAHKGRAGGGAGAGGRANKRKHRGDGKGAKRKRKRKHKHKHQGAKKGAATGKRSSSAHPAKKKKSSHPAKKKRLD